MAVIDTGLLTKGLRSEFFSRFAATQTFFQDLATRIASTAESESYKWLGSVPQMRERGSGRLAKGLRTESYSVENLDYEATLEVDANELADDQTGQIVLRVRELAQYAATHKDYLLSELLRLGATSGYNSYDGVTFFNAAHVSGASGNQTNLVAATAAAAAKTTAEVKAAVQAAIAAMRKLKDDQGQPMMLSLNGLAMVVPPELEWVTREALNASVVSSTSNVLVGAAKVICLPWLADATKSYLVKTDGVVRPFVFQDREPISFDSIAAGSEHAFKTGKYLYGVKARYRMAYGYWQHAIEITYSN